MFRGRRIHNSTRSSSRRIVSVALVLALTAGAAWASGGVTFTDIATGGGGGLVYSRTPSATIATFDFLTTVPVLMIDPHWFIAPLKPHGAPGVALFDYDCRRQFRSRRRSCPGRWRRPRRRPPSAGALAPQSLASAAAWRGGGSTRWALGGGGGAFRTTAGK